MGRCTLVLDGRIERPTIDLVLRAARTRRWGCATCARISIRRRPGSRSSAAGGRGWGRSPRRRRSCCRAARQARDRGRAARRRGNARERARSAIVTGGFDGRLAVAGGGLSGELLFRPVGAIQRIEAHLDAPRRDAGGDDAAPRASRPRHAARSGGNHDRGDRERPGAAARRAAASRASPATRGCAAASARCAPRSRDRAGARSTIQTVDAGRPRTATRSPRKGTLDRRPLTLVDPRGRDADDDGWRLAPDAARSSPAARRRSAGGSPAGATRSTRR